MATNPMVRASGQSQASPVAHAPLVGRDELPTPANDFGGAVPEARSAIVPPDGDRPLFTRIERSVIDIGNRDPLTLLAQGSRLERLRRLLFGMEASLPFGDRRLEALRRLTLALRRPGRSPGAEIAVALQEGVSPQQIEHLRLGR